MGDARELARDTQSRERPGKQAEEDDLQPQLPPEYLQDPTLAMSVVDPALFGQLASLVAQAGTNQAVETEKLGLAEGVMNAVQMKIDYDSFDSQTEGRQVEIEYALNGEGGGGGDGATTAEEAAPGDTGEALSFHAQRAQSLRALGAANQAASLGLNAVLASPDLDEAARLPLQQQADYLSGQFAALELLAGAYDAASGALSGNEFGGIAVPGSQVPMEYEARIVALQAQRDAVQQIADFWLAEATRQTEIAMQIEAEAARLRAEWEARHAQAMAEWAEAKAKADEAAAAAAEGGEEGGEASELPEPPPMPNKGPDPGRSLDPLAVAWRQKAAASTAQHAQLLATAAQFDTVLQAYQTLLGIAPAGDSGGG